jgi:hypothetical protein
VFAFQKFPAFVASALLAFAAVPAGAGAQQQPKVIREMTWRAHIGISTARETSFNAPTTTAANSPGAVAVSGGNAHAGGGAIANVEINVAVIGALPDDGLAVIVSESGDRKSEPIRVDIRGDGGTVVAPGENAKVTPEESRLVGLLGRRLVNGHDVGPGTTWTQTSADKAVKASSRYTVLSYVPEIVTIDFDQSIRAGGIRPLDMHTTGRFSYDLQHSVPVSAKLATRSHEGSLGDLTTWDFSFEYELVADSFGAVKPK